MATKPGSANRSPLTLRSYRNDLVVLEEHLGHDPTDATPRPTSKVPRRLPRSRPRRRHGRPLLPVDPAVLPVGRDEGEIDASPIARMRPPKVAERPPATSKSLHHARPSQWSARIAPDRLRPPAASTPTTPASPPPSERHITSVGTRPRTPARFTGLSDPLESAQRASETINNRCFCGCFSWLLEGWYRKLKLSGGVSRLASPEQAASRV
jgi:hypothetical protein